MTLKRFNYKCQIEKVLSFPLRWMQLGRDDLSELREHHSVDEGSACYQHGQPNYCQIDLMQTQLVSERTKNVYVPIRKISHGHFSTVYLSFCKTEKRYVAIKICKNDPEYESAFDDERRILEILTEKIKRKNLENNGEVVQLLDYFIHTNMILNDDGETETAERHYCFVMELLGHSVYKLLLRYSPKLNPRKAVPLPIVKVITRSLLTGLKTLHECGIFHTDVKPENMTLQYFLPEISEQSDYAVQELVFGEQSKCMFDAKLCTPARTITMNDYEKLDSEQKDDVYNYLMNVGGQQGMDDWMQIQMSIMDNRNYKMQLVQFLKQNKVSEIHQSVYKVQGLNIFNVQNLMREAERMFRLSYVPNEDSPEVDYRQKQISLKSAKSKISKNSLIPAERMTYDIIDRGSLAESTLTSLHGIKITVSHCEDVGERSLFVEKLYYDEHKPQTIYRLARSGLHSRIFLMQRLKVEQRSPPSTTNSMQSPSLEVDLPQAINLPMFDRQHDQKCFALNSDGIVLYPTLVSYFSKKMLIPFCQEMFRCKLIDLGNAYQIAPRKHNYIISTRQYRAPEVILQCPYNEKVDVFSAACVIFELVTGDYLFQTRQDQEEHKRDRQHLEMIIKICGSRGLEKLLETADPAAKALIIGNKPLCITEHTPISTLLVEKYSFQLQVAVEVEKLLEPMLQLDWTVRCSSTEALDNSWLQNIGDGDYLTGYGGRQ